MALAQGAVTGVVTDVFVQYSVLGVVALLALGAVRVLFQRETQAHDLERKRAERLEDELRQLNRTVQDRYVTTLIEATTLMADVLDELKQRDDHVERGGRR